MWFTIVLRSRLDRRGMGSATGTARSVLRSPCHGGENVGLAEVTKYMSYLLFDFLLPIIGPSAAEYWASIFVVGPL